MWRMWRVGIGYRQELSGWIHTRPGEITCVEVTAEHFFDQGKKELQWLCRHYPVMVHCLGLSLGTPGKLDSLYLNRLDEVIETAAPEWISDHIAFTRTDDVDLGHLNPIPATQQTLDILIEHAQELMEHYGRPLILENITSYLRLPGSMSETEFMNRLCERSGCGLLLDVTNLYINSRNHQFDAIAYLHEINPQHIVQLHVAGYSQVGARLEDLHAQALQSEIWKLIDEVFSYAPVRAVIIERDQNFPPLAQLTAELHRLEAAIARY